MGKRGMRRSTPTPHYPFSKEIPYERGLHSWVEPPELRRQATTQVVVVKQPAREGCRSGIMGGRRRTQRAASAMRALPLYEPPPSLPSHSLPYHGLEARVVSCGSSQLRQRGKQPELRRHAAAQVVATKAPAREVPERDHGGTKTHAEGGKCDARASPTRRLSPCPPTPYPAMAWRRMPWYGSSQVCQRGEQPKLRRHAAAQVVVAEKPPARGVPERDHGGTEMHTEGGNCDVCAFPTRRLSPCPPTPDGGVRGARCGDSQAP